MADPSVSINFDRTSKVFFPGQKITGHVHINSDSHHKCSGIEIIFCGKCTVKFDQLDTVRVDGKQETQNKEFSEKETYYKNQYTAWSAIDDHLSAGDLHLPFEFSLPYSSPASYCSPNGQVTHFCKVNVKLVGASNVKKTAVFNVNTIVDLNKDPINREAQTRQEMKTLCCLCCRSGPIEAQVHLEHRGYVPGEALRVRAEISNGSNKIIDGTSAKLMTVVRYTAQGKTQTETYQVCSLNRGPIAPHDEFSWKDEFLKVPPIAASELQYCKLINISYYLKFTVDPSGLSFNLDMEFPIYIGTIPLTETFSTFGPVQPKGEETIFPADAAVFPGQELYPNMPLPSYAHATSEDIMTPGGKFSDKPNAKSDFKPVYLCYGCAEADTAI